MRQSDSILFVVNRLIAGVVGQGKLVISSMLVRKSAHFLEYFVLGFLLSNGFYKLERKLGNNSSLKTNPKNYIMI